MVTSKLPILDKWDGTYEGKERLHRDGKTVLRAVAKALGLKPGQYDLRSNKGGIAVGGEVYLHTDSLYLWISGGYPGRESDVIARRCNGRNDFKGDRNHSIDWELLWDPKALVSVLKTEGIVS